MKFKKNDITWRKLKLDGVPSLVIAVNNELLERNSTMTTNFQPHFLPYTVSTTGVSTEFTFDITGLESYTDYHRRKQDTPEQLWRLRLLALDLSNNFFPKLFPIFSLDYMFVSDTGELWMAGVPIRRNVVQNSWIADLIGDFDSYHKDIMKRKSSLTKSLKEVASVSFLGGILGSRGNGGETYQSENTTETLAPHPTEQQASPVSIEIKPATDGLRFGIVCDIGDAKPSNQDRVFARTGRYNSIPFGVFMVADGMGGMAHGEVASSMALQRIEQWYDSSFLPSVYGDGIITAMRELDHAINTVNQDIIHFAQQRGERVGTTLTICAMFGNDYIIRHVGDSRVYYCGSGQLQQLTRDHSFVASELEKGNITPEQAANHPRKNVLTQCIGVHSVVDVFQTSGVFSSLQQGFVLVCSDGFHNYFPWQCLDAILQRYNGDNLQALTDEMRTFIPLGSAKDNVSCIVVHLS